MVQGSCSSLPPLIATNRVVEEQAALPERDPNVDVSVVIVSWNTADLLRTCLVSLLQDTSAIQIETIVVDNASADGSAGMVAREFPEAHLIVNPRNEGFAAANNRGLSQARGRYLLLLNSDTVMLSGALEGMVRYMDAHGRVGALGPRILNDDRSVQLSAHDFPRLDHDAVVLLEVKHWPVVGDLARRYARRVYAPDRQETREVDWVVGACLLLRREALEEIGLLDERYFFFFEEPDLCMRLRQRNWSTVFLASSEIVHRGGQSRARVPAASLIWYYRGLLRYYRLHRSRRRYLLVRSGVAIGALGQVIWRLLWRPRDLESHNVLAAYARILTRAIQD